MTTPKARTRPAGVNAAPVPLPRPPGDEICQTQNFVVRSDALSSKQRADSSTMPQLTDNPLYEGLLAEDAPMASAGCCARANSQMGSEQRAPEEKRALASRHSLDESRAAPSRPSRRKQSWSLSSRDYESMWRTVQENVFKSSRSGGSALEDFNQFRRKLADLKQAKSDMSAPPPTPAVLTPSGSIRCSNAGSVSTRSLNIPTSRPTSPLQRLSVLTSRKGPAALHHPQRDFSHRGNGQLPPSVHRFALSMRAEGLFKLPNPASISPLTGDQCSPPQRSNVCTNSDPNPPASDSRSSRFCTRARVNVEEKKPARLCLTDKNEVSFSGSRSPRKANKPRKGAAGGGGTYQPRSRVPACVSNEIEAFLNICSPRAMSGLHNVTPTSSPQRPPRRQQQQAPDKILEKLSAASLCGPRAKASKARCIQISRPMCYGAHILE